MFSIGERASALPTVQVYENREGVYHEDTLVASYEEAFKQELARFYDCIVDNREPLTSGIEGRRDTELLIQFVRTYVGSK